MSDTPRTDTTDLYDYQTAVDFSRSLERENTELRECLIAMLSNFGGIACAKTHPYDWDRWRKAAFPALSNAEGQGCRASRHTLNPLVGGSELKGEQ